MTAFAAPQGGTAMLGYSPKCQTSVGRHGPPAAIVMVVIEDLKKVCPAGWKAIPSDDRLFPFLRFRSVFCGTQQKNTERAPEQAFAMMHGFRHL